MPIVKIHVSTEVEPSVREAVIGDVSKSIVDNLGVNFEHAFVILYDSSSQVSQINKKLNNNLIFIETFMFTGRPDEVKENFFTSLANIVKTHFEVDDTAVFFNIIDSDRNNWADINGIPYSKINS